MTTLFITHDTGVLGKRGSALSWGERGGSKNVYPTATVDEVVVLGNGSVSTQAIRMLLEEDIPLHYVSTSGRYMGSLTSGQNRGRELRKKQEEAAASLEKTLAVARGVVVGKILNQRKNLIRATYRKRNTTLVQQAIARLEQNASQAGSENDLEALRGIEGIAAAAYFYAFEDMLASGWTFKGRNRRPPKDPVNAMLSFAYTLLLSNVVTAVLANRLDPLVGFLHPEYRGRPSAALDLMEEFRPSVSDRVVIALINQGMVAPGDFESDGNGGVKMNPKARRVLVEAHNARLASSSSSETTEHSLPYRRRIHSQAESLARAIWHESDYIPFVAKK